MLLVVTEFEGFWTLDAGESYLIEHVDNLTIGSTRFVRGPAVGTVVFSFGPFLDAQFAIECVASLTLYHISRYNV